MISIKKTLEKLAVSSIRYKEISGTTDGYGFIDLQMGNNEKPIYAIPVSKATNDFCVIAKGNPGYNAQVMYNINGLARDENYSITIGVFYVIIGGGYKLKSLFSNLSLNMGGAL